jgi:hypothetical protein
LVIADLFFDKPTHCKAVSIVHQRTDMKPVEKIVNFTLQFNVDLRLGGDFAMVHLSPFSLILL